MIQLTETLIGGKSCFKFSKPFDTKKMFLSSENKEWVSKPQTATLNIVNVVEYYDLKQCIKDYEDDDETDEDGFYVRSLEDYVDATEHTYKEGLFLLLSDDTNCFLQSNAKLHLAIDGKKNYELQGFFSPAGTRGGYNFTTAIYFQITPPILKSLAFASSIKLSYEVPDDKEKDSSSKKSGFNNLDISRFSKFANAYYEGYYIEHLGTPEEKATYERECQIKKEEYMRKVEEANARRVAEEAEAATRKAKELAERKAEWEAADPVGKLTLLLKRHWKWVIVLLFILYFIAIW